MPGSRLGRNLKLPGILNLDMEVVHCNLRDPFSVRWCLGRPPCGYVHCDGVRCSTLSDRVFLRFICASNSSHIFSSSGPEDLYPLIPGETSTRWFTIDGYSTAQSEAILPPFDTPTSDAVFTLS